MLVLAANATSNWSQPTQLLLLYESLRFVHPTHALRRTGSSSGGFPCSRNSVRKAAAHLDGILKV